MSVAVAVLRHDRGDVGYVMWSTAIGLCGGRLSVTDDDGSCAPIGCMSDPDCEPCGADGNCTDGCALPDPDCATSEPGEICQAETQCTTGLCVFWSTDPSYHFCSRECEPGGADCPTGMSCQSVQPFGSG